MSLSFALALTLTGWLGSAPPEVEPAQPSEVPTLEPVELPTLSFVAVDGLDAPALESEIAMRMPELRVRSFDGTRPTEPFMYIQAWREADKVHRIAIIFSDGRAYYEHLDVGEAGSPERVLASAIVNLLVSIGSGAIEPDQHGVTTPLTTEPEPEHEPEPEQEPQPQPVLDADPDPKPPEPKVELSVSLGLGQATGLGAPRFADAHLGFFGSLELSLRTRRGLFVALEFRPGGSSSQAFRLTRLQTELGLGYAFRIPNLEFVVATTVAVSAWLVSSEGRAEPVTRLDGSVPGRPPLLAFGLRLSPGYRAEFERGTLRSLRVGPRLEATGGFVTSAPPRIAGLQSSSGEELFRLGGVELFAGIELTLWLAPTAR